MSKNLFEHVFKILVAGEGGVGKTTLLLKYVNGTFCEDTSMTIGIQFHHKVLQQNDVEYSLQLWDFGGQDRFRFMLPNYALGAKGALLLYDTTRMSTMDSLAEWVKICRTHDPGLPILFVGTKIDLVEDRSVPADMAKDYLKPLEMFDYIEVSSKTGENVEQAFQILVQRIADRVPHFPEHDVNPAPAPQPTTAPKPTPAPQPAGAPKPAPKPVAPQKPAPKPVAPQKPAPKPVAPQKPP